MPFSDKNIEKHLCKIYMIFSDQTFIITCLVPLLVWLFQIIRIISDISCKISSNQDDSDKNSNYLYSLDKVIRLLQDNLGSLDFFFKHKKKKKNLNYPNYKIF